MSSSVSAGWRLIDGVNVRRCARGCVHDAIALGCGERCTAVSREGGGHRLGGHMVVVSFVSVCRAASYCSTYITAAHIYVHARFRALRGITWTCKDKGGFSTQSAGNAMRGRDGYVQARRFFVRRPSVRMRGAEITRPCHHELYSIVPQLIYSIPNGCTIQYRTGLLRGGLPSADRRCHRQRAFPSLVHLQTIFCGVGVFCMKGNKEKKKTKKNSTHATPAQKA